jgi:hypothetical protein
MKDIYNEAAKKAAHVLWQTASKILPQVGVWVAAIVTGNVVDWARGNNKPADNQAPKKGWLSYLNPLSAVKALNPVSLISFAAKPFTNIKKAASWFLFESLAYEMKNDIAVPFKAVEPIAEKFMAPILEKFTTPAINYLKETGLMQFPKPDVVCPEIVCPTLVCELPVEEIKEIAKTVAPETKEGIFSTLLAYANPSNVANYFTQPILDLNTITTKTVSEIPTPLEEVFSVPAQETVKAAAKETAKKVAKSFVEPIKEATKAVVKNKVPTTYLELTEQHAEPAGRYVAQTMSSAYQGVSKAIRKPSEITIAMKNSVHIFSEAAGVHPGWVIGAAVTVAGLAGLGAYATYRGAYNWYNKSTAVANANAQANGGQANGNNVNFLVQFPLGQAQNGAPAQAVPQITQVPMNAPTL